MVSGALAFENSSELHEIEEIKAASKVKVF